MLQEPYHPCMTDAIEELLDVGVQDGVHPGAHDPKRERIQRIMLASPWPESIREPQEISLIYGIQHFHHAALDDLVFQRGDAERPLAAVRLGDVFSPRR
ncbi:hypothetical protein METHB2_330007 [Candidatus Methylobacter favarea]|uniref:Uncharacterized protein n=1 Tax=Candidatus Methylobacter favarea TaxID=2707345 RepID=A0A8S0WJ54_9GAMM|nr:hypothetical protein METHB2_330007 [Candidatus Methylobacter favarea]